MTFVVWAGTVFGPCLWQLSARRRSLAVLYHKLFLRYLGYITLAQPRLQTAAGSGLSRPKMAAAWRRGGGAARGAAAPTSLCECPTWKKMRLRKSNALLFCRPCISLRDLHNHDKDPPKEVKYTISVAVTVFFSFAFETFSISKFLRLVAGYLGVEFQLGKFDRQTKRCPYFLGCTTWCSLYIQKAFVVLLYLKTVLHLIRPVSQSSKYLSEIHQAQAVIRWSLSSYKTVIRLSSDSHQVVIGKSSGSHWSKIKCNFLLLQNAHVQPWRLKGFLLLFFFWKVIDWSSSPDFTFNDYFSAIYPGFF